MGDREERRAALFADHARRYAELGWAVIPLNGKIPRSRRWQETEPASPALAAGAWMHWGKRHEIGVNLGASGLAVLEDDTEAGRSKLVELLGDELANVPIVESGGRSQHRYYLDAGYENAARDGIELRCGRQQCVLPPSAHPDTGRPYRWLVEPWAVELGPVPQPVLDFFAAGKWRLFADPVGDEIREPMRRRTLLSIAGTLRRRGLGADEILVALATVNETRCRPPLPDRELADLARDVARRYAPAPPDLEQGRIEEQADQLLITPEVRPPTRSRGTKRQLQQRPISAVTPKQVELLNSAVPIGFPTLNAGIGGLGKSALMLAWAAPVTTAGGDVLLVSYEDAAEQVMRPRFEALGGDLDRLHELYVDPLDGSVSFPDDLPDLERIIVERRARLLLIDPVSASINSRLDSHKDAHMRVVLGQLAALAARHEIAIVMNAHLNKQPTVDPYLRINGSVAFYNAARSVVTVTPDPLDPETQRLVAQQKSNLGRLAPVQRWRIEVVEVPSPSGAIETMKMVYVEDADDVAREDVLAAASADKQTEAAALILAELAFERRLSSEVKAAGMKVGISTRTIQRAAQDLEVIVEEKTTENGRVTYWSLPAEGSRQPLPHESGATPSKPHGKAHQQARAGGSRQISDVWHGATPKPPQERQEGEGA